MAEAGPSRAGGPPPTKRIRRIEAISGCGDAATRAANALDLEADDVPEQLKCPICKEVPLGEVIQCINGHPICKECQMQTGKTECAQCRASMKPWNGGGHWMRVRMMEELLDALWFKCPFRKYGCKETLSRSQVRGHKDDCYFNPERVQICKYFHTRDCWNWGDPCNYWTRLAKPEMAVNHLGGHMDVLCQNLDYFLFDVGEPILSYRVEGVVTKRNGAATFLTIAWSDPDANELSFACLRMDKPTPGETEATKAELTLERQVPLPCQKIPNWKLTLPIVSVLDTPKILRQRPGIVSRLFLKKFLRKEQVKEPIQKRVKDTNQNSEDSESEDEHEEECKFSSSEEDENENVKVKILISIS